LMKTKLPVLPFFEEPTWLVSFFWPWWRTLHCVVSLL
jgi:hypothetical protein